MHLLGAFLLLYSCCQHAHGFMPAAAVALRRGAACKSSALEKKPLGPQPSKERDLGVSLHISRLSVEMDDDEDDRDENLEAAATAPVGAGGSTVMEYKQLEVETLEGISLHDITPQIKELVAKSGVKNGFVNVLSRHTTTSILINEAEDRLVDDIRQYLLRLAPPSHPYLHNDLHVRKGPEDWPGGDEAWRAQEPKNAHSHLLSMLIGNSESIPVAQGELTLGTWQSVMMVELDGPRNRTVGVQIVGMK